MKTYVIGREFKINGWVDGDMSFDSIWTFIGQPNSAELKYKKWCFFNSSIPRRKCFTSQEMKGLDIIPL